MSKMFSIGKIFEEVVGMLKGLLAEG